MTTVFLKSGSVYTPVSSADLDAHPTLPSGNYIIVKDPMTGALKFRQVDPFNIPSKLYGSIMSRAERILNTYNDRPNATGVLLSGEKGSGKTQLARLVSHLAAQAGIPTIIINSPYTGDEFFKLIQSVEQRCIVLFDEFEKVYDFDDQKKVLTLLDGAFPSKKLFMMTSNDKWLINDHMRNRPGRIYYLLEYKGLEPTFITEYCQDTLVDQEKLPQIHRVARMFAEFNFDMLKALVEEMNRYHEDPEVVLQMLNARPTTDKGGEYAIHLFVGGEKADRSSFYPSEQDGSPMHEKEIYITWTPPETSDGEVAEGSEEKSTRRSSRKPSKRTTYVLRQQHMSKFDSASGTFEYTIPEDDVVVRFTRVVHEQANFASLLV